MASQYTPDARSKANRLSKRASYDAPLIHSLVNSCPILHVSFNAPVSDSGESQIQFPTILPMLGAVGSFPPSSSPGDDTEAFVYLHGSSAARLFKLTPPGGLPLCIAATHMDGYVLALAPFHNSCNYRSAVVFGIGNPVTDPEEIEFALKLITNNSIPSRWENSRHPPTKAEITSTGVLKVRIETASAKVRTGGPSDDRADLKDEALMGRTWTGVVPLYSVLGTPIESEYNKVKQVPEYLGEWVEDANSMAEQRAVDAVES